MGTVRRHNSEEYTVAIAVVNKVHSEVTAMAVNYEQPPLSPAAGFLLRAAIKHLLKPVRVRWINHKCKVNSDEFDKEESYLRARHL